MLTNELDQRACWTEFFADSRLRRFAQKPVVPSQDEWIKAASFDPNGGGRFSYWESPTGPFNAPNASLSARTEKSSTAPTKPLATDTPVVVTRHPAHSRPGARSRRATAPAAASTPAASPPRNISELQGELENGWSDTNTQPLGGRSIKEPMRSTGPTPSPHLRWAPRMREYGAIWMGAWQMRLPTRCGFRPLGVAPSVTSCRAR